MISICFSCDDLCQQDRVVFFFFPHPTLPLLKYYHRNYKIFIFRPCLFIILQNSWKLKYSIICWYLYIKIAHSQLSFGPLDLNPLYVLLFFNVVYNHIYMIYMFAFASNFIYLTSAFILTNIVISDVSWRGQNALFFLISFHTHFQNNICTVTLLYLHVTDKEIFPGGIKLHALLLKNYFSFIILFYLLPTSIVSLVLVILIIWN